MATDPHCEHRQRPSLAHIQCAMSILWLYLATNTSTHVDLENTIELKIIIYNENTYICILVSYTHYQHVKKHPQIVNRSVNLEV